MKRVFVGIAILAGLAAAATAAVVVTGRVPGPVGGLRIAMPLRRPIFEQPALAHADWSETTRDGLTLRGWLFAPETVPKGLIVYLHGKDENRRFGAAIAERYVPRGYEILTFDLRAHGASGGLFTTYGALEVGDLSQALDSIPVRPVILIGESLGAAIALQTAASDERVRGVVVVASFAALEPRIREQAGRLEVEPSFEWIGRHAGFRVQDISPRRAAERIRVPVLLIHGTRDTVTPFHHSQEIFDALAGEKRLLRVEGAGHQGVLNEPGVWATVDEWLSTLPR